MQSIAMKIPSQPTHDPARFAAPAGLLSVLALLLVSLSLPQMARAGKPPELKDPVAIERTISVGENVELQVHYSDAEQEKPIEAGVMIITPSGDKLPPVKLDESDRLNVHNDSLLTFFFRPTEAGLYKYYFYAIDADGKTIFPEGDQFVFKVQPNWLPWAIIGGGFLVCMVIIAALFYQIFHRAFGLNQHGSARGGLMIGFVAWAVTILYALNKLNDVLAWIIALVALAIVLVWAFLVAR